MNRKGFLSIVILLVVMVLLVVGGVWYWQAHHSSSSETQPLSADAQNQTTGSPAASLSDLQKLQAAQALWEEDPTLAITPVSRTLVPIVPKNSLGFSDFGLSFSVPWTNIATTTKTIALLILKFTNGNQLVLLKGDNGSSSVSAFRGYYNFQSGYDVYSTALETVPGTLSSTLALSDQELALKGALLNVKQVQTETLPTGAGIYSFQTNAIRGFQMGAASASGTTINFFDANDNQYSLIIQGTQGEIDYVLSSFK